MKRILTFDYIHCLCQAKVNDSRDRLAVHFGDQDVGRLKIAMNDCLLVGVLHRFANRYEQLQAIADSQLLLIQYSVMGTPGTYSITKYGWPSDVVPASNTFAIDG